jgi:hypothetical protein
MSRFEGLLLKYWKKAYSLKAHVRNKGGLNNARGEVVSEMKRVGR